MNTRKLAIMTIVVAVACMTAGLNARAQTTSVLTSNLKAPSKIIRSLAGNLIVAESGDAADNSGRISIIDPASGERRTLINGLPSALSPVGGGEPDGPSGLSMGNGRTFYVVTGLGDATLPGPFPGTEVPNPDPASPLFSALLELRLSSQQAEQNTTGFTLTLEDQFTLKNEGRVTLFDGVGNKLFVKLILDLPDYVSEPRPGLPGNVRGSHPYGLLRAGDDFYISDAGLNSVLRVDAGKRTFETLVQFPTLPNTLPFGPPRVEAVPSSVRLHDDNLLVPLFTGFPFPPGASEIREVHRGMGGDTTFIANLTTAIDILVAEDSRAPDRFFVLEFSTNLLTGAPGRLLQYDSPDAAPTVVVGDLITPSNMARDAKSGVFFVTETSTGRVIRITP